MYDIWFWNMWNCDQDNIFRKENIVLRFFKMYIVIRIYSDSTSIKSNRWRLSIYEGWREFIWMTIISKSQKNLNGLTCYKNVWFICVGLWIS